MLRLLWNLSIRVRLFLRTYMPTNILLNALRTRRGLKWGVPAMLIAVPYLLGAWLLTVWIAEDGPGWLNLLVLLFIWNALKFLVNGPITLIALIRVRVAERDVVRWNGDLGQLSALARLHRRGHDLHLRGGHADRRRAAGLGEPRHQHG